MELIMYSTNCPRCKTMAMQMDKKKLSYAIHTDVAEMESLGIRSVPALCVDGELMTYEKSMQWIAGQKEGMK